MATSTNLGLLLLGNISERELVFNEAVRVMSDMATNSLTVTSSTTSLTAAQINTARVLYLTGTLTGSRTLTIPTSKRFIWVIDQTLGGYTTTLSTGTGTTVSTEGGDTFGVYVASTGAIVVYRQRPSIPYDISAYFPSGYVGSQVMLRRPFVRTITYAANLVGSRGYCEVAPTGTVTFSIKKNGAEFGTATFAASATTATFTGSATTVTASDILTVVAPITQDATMSSITLSLAGTI